MNSKLRYLLCHNGGNPHYNLVLQWSSDTHKVYSIIRVKDCVFCSPNSYKNFSHLLIIFPGIRWTINLALKLLGDIMEVEHKVDSEDLVHCDLMAICSFIGGVLMKGLQFRQARAVVEKIGRWGSIL